MKPQDLDDHAPVEPDDELLANVHARSRSLRRRRSTQRFASVTTALVVLALASGIAWTRLDATNGRGISPAATSTTTQPSGPALTQNAIMGKWRPVSIAGYSGPLTKPPLGWEPHLSFNGRGRWSGSDGCNDIGGTYRLEGNGVHFFTLGGTLVNCSDNPDFEPIEAAARSEVRNDQLTFLTADGHEIARFVRAGVTARIELPSTTMTAGSIMMGHVVVENDTGHEIAAGGCGSLFALLLASASYHPQPIWRLCAQRFTIPVGESRYPAPVIATYNVCEAAGDNGVPRCQLGGGPVSLPPGNYQAQFFQSSPVVLAALPIDVTVTAPPSPH